MAKYKVGDRARIVSKRPPDIGFTDEMCEYLGKTMTIPELVNEEDGMYAMRDDHRSLLLTFLYWHPLDPPASEIKEAFGHVWREEWISGLAEEPKEIPGEPLSVHIRFCGAMTVAELMKGGKVVKSANARCNLDDIYNCGEGAKVAVNRLFEKKQKTANLWNVGDKFRVVRGNGLFKNGDIVTLFEKRPDGIHRYKDAYGRTCYMADFRVAPYKEDKK